NATTHGLTSTRCPDPRSSTDFDTLRRELEEEHRPTTATQHALISELTHIVWKLTHIPQIEHQILNAPLPPSPPEYSKDRPGEGRGEGSASFNQDPSVSSAPSDSSFSLPPSSLYSSTIAAHFLTNTATPLTRIYAHH